MAFFLMYHTVLRDLKNEEQREAIEADMAPFGFIQDGMDDNSFVDDDGERWFTDEYGDRAYMWEYR